MSYKFAILTPEGQRYAGDVESLVAPGVAGSFGILPHHAPMVSALQAGIVDIAVSEGTELFFMIGGGIIEVKPDGVTLLADTAEQAVNRFDAERKLEVLGSGNLALDRSNDRSAPEKVKST